MTTKEYRPLTIPRIVWEKEKLTDVVGELVVHPLEPGFGTTIGNALRRVLLSSVEGAAVTAIIVKGVNNEFSTIPGVVEDAMQLVLNIKEIVVRSTTGQAGTMRVTVNGEATVRVGDIVPDAHLELVNKDHVVAHVAPGGSLDITFFVEPGRGYVPAQWPADKAYQEDGKIYVDSMFSPVRRVTFEVEKTRVGQHIDYDKLFLRIETDESQKPVDVLHYAVSVLRTQLEHFLAEEEIPFNDISSVPEDVTKKKKQKSLPEGPGLKGIPIELLLKPIEELELTVRAHKCLASAGKERVIDLVNASEDEMLKIKNFGRKSLTEVKDVLKSFGLSFGMSINEEEVKRALAAAAEETE